MRASAASTYGRNAPRAASAGVASNCSSELRPDAIVSASAGGESPVSASALPNASATPRPSSSGASESTTAFGNGISSLVMPSTPSSRSTLRSTETVECAAMNASTGSAIAAASRRQRSTRLRSMRSSIGAVYLTGARDRRQFRRATKASRRRAFRAWHSPAPRSAAGRPGPAARGRNRLDPRLRAGLRDRLGGKVIPAYRAGVDGVVEAVSVGLDQPRKRVGEVAGKRRRSDDVGNDAQRRVAAALREHALDERFAAAVRWSTCP